jgi:hypothetical protein
MATGEREPRDSPALVHEQEAQVSPPPRHGKPTLGEELGPFPTISAGNSGPVQQSASHAYATKTQTGVGVILFAIRPGRVNLGPLTPPRYFPSTAVRSLSMERIIVDESRFASEQPEHA